GGRGLSGPGRSALHSRQMHWIGPLGPKEDIHMKRILIVAMASVATALLIPVVTPTEAYGAAAADTGKTMSQVYRERGKEDVEFQKVPPFKIFDNVWYVG